jgi:hypothetical protein
MGDQLVLRPLFTQDNTKTMNADRYSCIEWDSGPQSQCLSGQNVIQETQEVKYLNDFNYTPKLVKNR